jgi:hypothetical protein
MDYNREFEVDVVGESTKTRYEGTFIAKMVMTRLEKFEIDEKRRKYLGVNPQGALSETIIEAFILSTLQVRLTTAPEWWKITREGADIKDDNVLNAIYEALSQAEIKFRDEQGKDMDEALARLKDQ